MSAAATKRSPKRVLPGFGLTPGYTLFYISIIVLILLSALVFKTFTSASHTHLRAHETSLQLVCRLLLEKKKDDHASTIS